MPFRISVDTGGTFTDLVVADETGIRLIEKARTTPDRIFNGMLAAIEAAAARLGHDTTSLLAQTTTLTYGTTRATNAIVQNRTARTAFLTTEGFPDILVVREGGKFRPHQYDVDYPDPYVPRRYTWEVRERISSEGEVEVAFDEAQARSVVRTMKEHGIEAVGVCFLWSIANPVHELAMADLLLRELPDVPFTLSHQLIPIVREYRRASATCIDASLKPLMQRHLHEMEADLRGAGFAGEILVSTSVGGCMHIHELAERPIHTVKSGPAMAPVAGRVYAQQEQLGVDAIVCDTGGTTFDVGLVRGGDLSFTRDSWLGEQWTGHIMSMSTVDVRSIGAGGGSIAWIDSGGLLRVGPHSAGSLPGPACYGAGGTEPTITDAALLLGYIDPDYFLGGRMRLDVEAATRAVDTVAARLQLGLRETSHAIVTLANEHMIKAIHEITVLEGLNPRDNVIIAGGGAAGINIAAIARELRCAQVVVPRTASALSACGMQFSDVVFEHAAAFVTRTNKFDHDGVNHTLTSIRGALEGFVQSLRGRGLKGVKISCSVEARYLFQVWELDVTLPVERFDSAEDVARLVEGFHAVHERVLGVRDTVSPVECLNWRGRVSCRMAEIPPARKEPVREADVTPKGRRRAWFGTAIGEDCPVYRGEDLFAGAAFAGPAIVEEPTTTVVVYPGMNCRVSETGNYVIETNG